MQNERAEKCREALDLAETRIQEETLLVFKEAQFGSITNITIPPLYYIIPDWVTELTGTGWNPDFPLFRNTLKLIRDPRP